MTKFLTAYVVAALWSSTDGDKPLDATKNISDISPELLASMTADCKKFQTENAKDLEGLDEEQAGHDFWLTANHHGAGFWDGDYEEALGERLTNAAHKFPEMELYIGDDGKIYA